MWRHEFSKRESNSRTYKSGELMHKHNISVFRIISRIKLICLRSELNVSSFRICMDAAFFCVSSF